MLHYILQLIAFQTLFLLIYDLFLKQETFFNWNRFYLIATPIISVVLPLIKINAFKQVLPESYVIQLPAVILNPASQMAENQVLPNVFFGDGLLDYPWNIMFYLGMTIAGVVFLIKLYKLIRTIYKSKVQQQNGINLVTIKNSKAAFSFFNYVFLGDQISEAQYQSIMLHETVHVKQKHSADLLFFEVLRILFWYNPLIYMYQNRMVTLHEYIADSQVVAQHDKATYYENLLSQVFEVQNISFINPFFKQSLIKKRIIMLTKTKSKQIQLAKYALIIPLIAGMLVYTSCEKDKNSSNAEAETEVTSTEREVVSETDVPFAEIDEVPIYPGCEDLPAEEQKSCFSTQISKFVGKNFNTDLAGENNLTGRQRINVEFKIDSNGQVVDAKSRALDPSLEAEANRVVNALPKMTPGKVNGEAVNVLYSLPIVFQVQE